MTIVIPQYMIGKNVTAASVNIGTTSSAGIFTPGTGSAIADLHTLGVFDMFTYQENYNGFEVSPLDGFVENFIGGKTSFTVTVGEIQGSGMYANLLNAWYLGLNYRLEVDAMAPGGTVTNKLVVICTKAGGSLDFPIVEGKNTVQCTFRPCGVLPFYGAGTSPI